MIKSELLSIIPSSPALLNAVKSGLIDSHKKGMLDGGYYANS